MTKSKVKAYHRLKDDKGFTNFFREIQKVFDAGYTGNQLWAASGELRVKSRSSQLAAFLRQYFFTTLYKNLSTGLVTPDSALFFLSRSEFQYALALAVSFITTTTLTL